MSNRHLIHAHSSVVTEGQPKLPSADRIEYGELAINFAKDNETISLKNSDNEIVTFSSMASIQKIIDANEYVTSAALNDLNNRLVDANDDITENANNITEINNDITEINNNITEINSTISQMNTLVSNKVDKVISKTYSQLKTMRDNSELEPGQLYRITDYVTTTTQTDTQSANHAFDIVVVATDASTFNENALAVKHDGDTYFSNSNLNAWVLKYTIDNDTTKYTWADTTNGKGVIYYMKDENQNECPYDFKNIQFKRNATNESLNVSPGTKTNYITFAEGFYYTFDNSGNDASMNLNVHSNSFGIANVVDDRHSSGSVDYKIKLNNNVFITNGEPCHGNRFGNNCFDNTFVGKCYNNIFGSDCENNLIGDNFADNVAGNRFSSNKFGPTCRESIFGNSFMSNLFVGSCSSNTFLNRCKSNQFGYYCCDNKFGNSGNNNIIPDNCNNITFENDIHHITFAKTYVYGVMIENSNDYITLTSTQTTDNSKHLRGIRIAQNTNPPLIGGGTPITKTISHNTVNDTFITVYQGTGSTSVVVQ